MSYQVLIIIFVTLACLGFLVLLNGGFKGAFSQILDSFRSAEPQNLLIAGIVFLLIVAIGAGFFRDGLTITDILTNIFVSRHPF